MSELNLDRLFILEMANNHMGSVEHGLHVIREFAKVCKGFDFNFAFKMQYRQLDTFIHPDFKDRMDIKYVKRFSETSLSRDDTRKLVQEIKNQGFLSICTPFDPESVDLIIEDGFDVLKIASCSFTDWPLLERIGECQLPVIGSTAGIKTEDIDNVVSFMKHRDIRFTLMHCVAEYPTATENLQLNQIDFLMERYPDIPIGYSTHEEPSQSDIIALAIAKGCNVFEKHVGVPTSEYSINAYSATPQQVFNWLTAAKRAFTICGVSNRRIEPTQKELDSLVSLRRGIYANNDIVAGERIKDSDVFMAIPTKPGHITANDWSKYDHYYATKTIKKGEPVLESNSRIEIIRKQIEDIVGSVTELLKAGNIVIPQESKLEISHHYGLKNFAKTGISMITVVNREYCKKLIVVLPGQNHPEQYHKVKEETFHVLYGTLDLALDGVSKKCYPGDVITIERGVRHAFGCQDGVVLEEISSNHSQDDSYYSDPEILNNPNRKTFVSFWLD
ncbi:MAG: N-acetylneuraminate synthase family protein [Magnetococcales bacterium]|nr:N-acetylneuraminate synthase family protein [Magnetococcales bacterium]